MRLKNIATTIGAMALVATPLVAQANAPVIRDAASVQDAEDIAGGSGLIIGLLALAAVVGGIILAVEDDNEPASP